jgi:hypothetical protein
MKFFDYKFIILIGLTIVVYFIYREIEYLRTKINRIEKDIINIHDYTNITDKPHSLPTKIQRVKPLINAISKQPTGQPTEQPTEQPDEQPDEQLVEQPDEQLVEQPAKQLIDDLSKIKLNIISDLYPMINTCNYTQKINNLIIIDEDNSEHCDYSTNIDTSCHLAVYSNENDSCEETQDEKHIDNTNTLLDSVADNNTLLDSIPDNTNTLLNSIPNNNTLLDSIPNNNTLLDSVGDNTNTLLDSVRDNTNTLLDSVGDNTNTLLDSVRDNTNTLLDSVADNNTLLENLDKYKLYEIKKIAEDNKIHINKKINGVYKPKTKNELIMEIIELKNI